MKTPKEYTSMINNNEITEDIIGEVLFSYNKRAKNYRDQKNKYRGKYDNYDNYEKNLEKEKEYYKKKENILKLFQPLEIHLDEKKFNKRVRYYDYEEEFYQNKDNTLVRSYYDRDTKEVVEFIDIIKECSTKLYFLYYKVGEFDFHQPINDPEEYNLNIRDLKDFTTTGKDINDLLSVQFCDKVYNKIMNNELQIKK